MLPAFIPPLGCEKDHKQLCLGSSTDRRNASILLVSRRHIPSQFKPTPQTMAPQHLLVLLPFQALLLFAPAGQAHTTGTTRFLPDGYRGMACRALAPKCMTKQQWANYCRKNILFYAWPKSCRDATDSHRHHSTEPQTRFLPDHHRGPTCLALSPSCMTRSQWAKVCKSRNYYVLPKSCRDALGLRRNVMPRPWLRRNVMPKPPIGFVPGLKDRVGVTCLALSEACMGRDAWAKVRKTRKHLLGR